MNQSGEIDKKDFELAIEVSTENHIGTCVPKKQHPLTPSLYYGVYLWYTLVSVDGNAPTQETIYYRYPSSVK